MKTQDIRTSIGHILTGLDTLEACLARGTARDADLDLIWTVCRSHSKTHPRKLNEIADLKEGSLSDQAKQTLEAFQHSLSNVLFRLRQERDHGENYQKDYEKCAILANLKLWFGSIEKYERQVGMRAMQYRLGADPKTVFRGKDVDRQIDLMAVAVYAVEVLTSKAKGLEQQWKQLSDYEQSTGLGIIEDLIHQDPLKWWETAALSERVRILEKTLQTLEQIREWATPENPTRAENKATVPRADTCAA